jgi:hypothetical protein
MILKTQLQQLMAMMILIIITAIFACGGIGLGFLFNYITTGIWFL